jgi:hypothetical protein
LEVDLAGDFPRGLAGKLELLALLVRYPIVLILQDWREHQLLRTATSAFLRLRFILRLSQLPAASFAKGVFRFVSRVDFAGIVLDSAAQGGDVGGAGL